MPRPTNTLKRGYSLTLADGHHIDLASIDPNSHVSPAIIAALKHRIIELEDQLATEQAPPAKRRKTAARADVTDDEVDVPTKAGPSTTAVKPEVTAATAKADTKKNKLLLKKIFDRLKKECKAADVKFQGTPKSIKFEEVMSVEEFNTLFKPGQLGRLIQPTPDNKPTSTVTIIEFDSTAAIREFFGSEFKGLKGNHWSRGGGPRWAKSVKLGQVDVEPIHLQASYAKNTMKLTLKFEIAGHEEEVEVPNRVWVTASRHDPFF